jgi:hypothetical protein
MTRNQMLRMTAIAAVNLIGSTYLLIEPDGKRGKGARLQPSKAIPPLALAVTKGGGYTPAGLVAECSAAW